ncbi:MAG: IPT/TIG domain-containing protein [Myxococcales bacterium]|nr:IPT/TIG domain-containing protein [Myxococcales bacterium]
MTFTVLRRVLVLAAFLLLPLSGCDDIVKKIVGVPGQDAPPTFPDFGVDGDGTVDERLGITGVVPSHGSFTGGQTVKIYGSGFGGKELTVTFDGKEVKKTDIQVLSPVQLEVVTPAGRVGPVDVKVEGGGEQAVLTGGYTYDPVALDPTSGPTAGGTLVTIQGKGTDFKAGMKLELGGLPLTDVEIVSATTVRGKTAPHAQGPVDLVFSDASGADVTIREAYTYYGSANPLNGGLGGGKLNGTLTVTVLNAQTRAPVIDAQVVLAKDRQLVLSGKTDGTGTIVFSRTDLTGPVAVSASAEKYETTTVDQFDARDLTIFLTPIIPPQPGPLPPGQRLGLIEGFVVFGGSTGAGSTTWNIVPEPKPGQKKRVYVYTTNSLIRFGAPFAASTATIDFDATQPATAWPYSMYSRLGSLAVYAIAGIYTDATGKFEPYAMGIARGLTIAPGDYVKVNVLINIPLTEKVTVEMPSVPSKMNRHRVRLAIDLGAEGFIVRDDTEIEGDGVPASLPIGRLPSFNKAGLGDAAYTVDVLLDNAGSPTGLPIVRATERTVQPVAGKIIIDKLIGAPVQTKPSPGGPLQGNTIAWTYDGATPNLAVTVIQRPDETPVWRIISPGTQNIVKLPDPSTYGLIGWPTGTTLVWLQWLAHLPGYDYNTFNYSHTSSSYWDRWSFDQFSFKVP